MPYFENLLVKEKNPIVKRGLKCAYKGSGYEFDCNLIRRPSFLILMDDLGHSSTFKKYSGNNSLYKFMISARHKSCMFFGFAIHSLVNMTHSIRESFKEVFVYRSMEHERLKQLFEELGLGSNRLNYNQFL